MGERPLWPHILAPDHRVAHHDDTRTIRDPLKTPLVEPVVAAERIRNAVVASGIEPLDLLPDPRNSQRADQDDRRRDQPLPPIKPHLIDAKRRLALPHTILCLRSQSILLAQVMPP